MEPPYIYRARCTRVVDGDTVDLIVDMGFRVTGHFRFRLFGIDTPELNAPDEKERARAVAAKARVEALVKGFEGESWPVRVRTYKADSFGRWVADIYRQDPNSSWVSISGILLGEGLAGRFNRS